MGLGVPMPTRWISVLVFASCSSTSFQGDFTSSPSGDADADADADSDTDPGEQEEDLLRLPPAQTDVYVFVANPERDTVTRIEVGSLAVDTAPVGRDPRVVTTTPDRSTAVVFNRGDSTVTLLDARSLASRVVPVRANFNALSMSPDGGWVVAWHDTARERPDDPPVEGVQSFNEASFVDVVAGTHQALAVGFDPQQVQFTPDGATAVVVSDSALALIDLRARDLSARLVELQPGELTPARAEEVVLSPGGATAWVRLRGSSDLRVVDLDTLDVELVAAGAEPTDLDLSPDGLTTVAVSREDHELRVFDALDPGVPARVVPLPAAASYGSLQFDPTGRRAVLFTNAAAEERYALWDPLTDEIEERALVKPVSSVGVSPDGHTLLVFHPTTDGPLTNELFRGKPALTLVDLDDFRTNPLLLPALPLAYTSSASGALGYLVTMDQNFLEVLDYDTLLHEQIPLPSPPVFLGVLPDLTPADADEPPAWVSQEYVLGRITFWDPDDRVPDTLTGFELNSRIEEEE